MGYIFNILHACLETHASVSMDVHITPGLLRKHIPAIGNGHPGILSNKDPLEKAFFQCLAYPMAGGGGVLHACLFQNGGCLLLMGHGSEWVGGFEGKRYIPGAGACLFRLYFPLCWSVGEWVGAS